LFIISKEKNMEKSLFFYSKFCQHSKKCYDLMASKGLHENFEYISVDKDPETRQRHRLVTSCGVKSVPSIFMGNRLICGKELFTFISGWGQQHDRQEKSRHPETPGSLEGFDSGMSFANLNSDNLINPPKDTGSTVAKVGSLKIPGRIMDEVEMSINEKTKSATSDLDKQFQKLMEERSQKMMV
jgi:glutaredoxin